MAESTRSIFLSMEEGPNGGLSLSVDLTNLTPLEAVGLLHLAILQLHEEGYMYRSPSPYDAHRALNEERAS